MLFRSRGERFYTYLTPAAGQRAALTLGDGVTLDARGLWSNLVQGGVDADQAYLDGGRISLRSSGDLSLGDGSRIDVSSGAALLADGKQVGGKGGDLTLSANTGSAAGDGRLQLGGELAGHGVAGAGTLSVQALRVSIGAAAQDGTLALAAGFFDKGFASYQVIGEQGLEVAEGAQVKVQRPLYRFRDAAASGADPLLALEPWLTPLYEELPVDGELRQRPGASLFLQAGSRQSGAGQVADSVLNIGRGSLLEVDPGQRIELRSVGQLNVDGRLNAWGGSIELGSVALPDPVRDQVESVGHQRAIRVGEQGVLDVAARAATALDF